MRRRHAVRPPTYRQPIELGRNAQATHAGLIWDIGYEFGRRTADAYWREQLRAGAALADNAVIGELEQQFRGDDGLTPEASW